MIRRRFVVVSVPSAMVWTRGSRSAAAARHGPAARVVPVLIPEKSASVTSSLVFVMGTILSPFSLVMATEWVGLRTMEEKPLRVIAWMAIFAIPAAVECPEPSVPSRP